MAKQTDINKLLEEILTAPVAYHRVYSKITGSANTGLLLSQIFYWSNKMHRPFYKTNEDFADDLGIGLSTFKASKARLVKLGFISTFLRGVPPTTHYILHKSAVLAQIRNWLEIDQLNGRKPTNQMGGNRPNNTKTTTKTTTENNNKKPIIFSVDAELELVLEKAKQKATRYELDLHQILPARNKAERTTYNRLREHLLFEYLNGDKYIFNYVLADAREVSLLGCNYQRKIFISKCKKAYGFKGKGKQGQLL